MRPSEDPPPSRRRGRTVGFNVPRAQKRSRSASPPRRDPIPSIKEQLEAKYRKDEEFWATLSKERKERERRSEEQKRQRESTEESAWKQVNRDPLEVHEERRRGLIDLNERYERLRRSTDECIQLVKDLGRRTNAYNEELRDIRRGRQKNRDEQWRTHH
ncbi:hypothetical protein DENSPDRAFT_845717 [Dentipellis sp. KUC8613]|nr:hypothetical protein DENSPDRAFT_845717 [Dentipellis sp. KUC8613]